jgi:hypothetical protein
MFVRIREEPERLIVEMVNIPRRFGDARVIGQLGAVKLPIDARDREIFWRELPSRFAAIELRYPGALEIEEKVAAVALIHDRIPRQAPKAARRRFGLKWTSASIVARNGARAAARAAAQRRA